MNNYLNGSSSVQTVATPTAVPPSPSPISVSNSGSSVPATTVETQTTIIPLGPPITDPINLTNQQPTLPPDIAVENNTQQEINELIDKINDSSSTNQIKPIETKLASINPLLLILGVGVLVYLFTRKK